MRDHPPRYFADIGPTRGTVRYGVVGDTAAVLPAPGDGPIGDAACVGRDGHGRSLWRLTVGGAELPQRFLIVDRRFRAGGRRWRPP